MYAVGIRPRSTMKKPRRGGGGSFLSPWNLIYFCPIWNLYIVPALLAGMWKRLEETIGFYTSPGEAAAAQERMHELVNVKLASRGFTIPHGQVDSPLRLLGRSLLANFEEKLRLFGEPLCPADQAIKIGASAGFCPPSQSGLESVNGTPPAALHRQPARGRAGPHLC